MKFKEFFSRFLSLRVLFLYGNVILMLGFFAAIYVDQTRGWKKYQVEFKKREVARAEEHLKSATSDAEKESAQTDLRAAKKMPMEIRQIWTQQMNAVDRCVTCHLGYDSLANTAMTTIYKDHPYSAPADSVAYDIHKAHDVQKFGCAVCHGGQGLATEVKAAHGEVEHWEKPLLKGTLLQSSCAKCHDNLAELNVRGENFVSEIIRAKKLFKAYGCIGCHQIGGEGGPISVDLKEETAAKPLSRIDFSHTGLTKEEQTLAAWIKIHLVKDPVTFVPGDPTASFNTEPIAPSGMPPFMMGDKDADALTAYILSLNRSGIPDRYLVARAPDVEAASANPILHGRQVYEKYGCTACHGADARGGIRNYNYQYDVMPNLRRSASTYTREEIKNKISEGVPFLARHDANGPQPPLYMPAWKSKIKGGELEDLVSYLLSIKE